MYVSEAIFLKIHQKNFFCSPEPSNFQNYTFIFFHFFLFQQTKHSVLVLANAFLKWAKQTLNNKPENTVLFFPLLHYK